MADQGCPNEGPDTRLFGEWGCRIQTALSFHSTTPPKELQVHVGPVTFVARFPPYVAVVVPLSPYADGRSRYFSVRLGWRWDPHWEYLDAETGKVEHGGYIFPEAIIKVMDHVVL